MTSHLSESIYRHYLQALLAGDSAQCKSIVDTLLDQGIAILELYEYLFRRSLYQIGDLWLQNQISVAEEHIATAITENLISQVHTLMKKRNQVNKRVFVSCITSDLHQIGARMVANLFELHGWGSFFLGANMPITDLLNAIERIQPDIVCLSAVLMEHLKVLEVTVHEIRLAYPYTPIIVGGALFSNLDPSSLLLNQVPHLHILQSVMQLEDLIRLYS